MAPDMRKEINRKAFHILGGAIFVPLIYFEIISWVPIAILLAIIVSVLYFIKITGKEVIVVSRIVDVIGRENEFPGLGSITFVLGVLISVFLFDKNIAAAAIMILAIGDASSAMIGLHLGRTKTILSKHKKLEGFIAGVILSFLGATPFVGYFSAFFSSLAAMLTELWDKTNIIDDNILMPLVAGIVMSLL